jgi:hypothetical protein
MKTNGDVLENKGKFFTKGDGEKKDWVPAFAGMTSTIRDDEYNTNPQSGWSDPLN